MCCGSRSLVAVGGAAFGCHLLCIACDLRRFSNMYSRDLNTSCGMFAGDYHWYCTIAPFSIFSNWTRCALSTRNSTLRLPHTSLTGHSITGKLCIHYPILQSIFIRECLPALSLACVIKMLVGRRRRSSSSSILTFAFIYPPNTHTFVLMN